MDISRSDIIDEIELIFIPCVRKVVDERLKMESDRLISFMPQIIKSINEKIQRQVEAEEFSITSDAVLSGMEDAIKLIRIARAKERIQ